MTNKKITASTTNHRRKQCNPLIGASIHQFLVGPWWGVGRGKGHNSEEREIFLFFNHFICVVGGNVGGGGVLLTGRKKMNSLYSAHILGSRCIFWNNNLRLFGDGRYHCATIYAKCGRNFSFRFISKERNINIQCNDFILFLYQYLTKILIKRLYSDSLEKKQ